MDGEHSCTDARLEAEPRGRGSDGPAGASVATPSGAGGVLTAQPLVPARDSLSASAGPLPAALASFFLVALSMMSIWLPWEGGTAPVDVVLIGATAVAALLLLATGPVNLQLEHALVRITIAVWAYVTLATIWTVFFAGDPMRLLMDAYSFFFLLTPLVLLRAHPDGPHRVVYWAIAAAGLFGAVTIFLDPLQRPDGALANPNMAATWLGGAAVLLAATRLPGNRVVKLLVVAIMLVACLRTQSYSAVLAVLAALVYWAALSNRRPLVRLSAYAAFGVGLIAWQWILASLPGEDRLERSRGSRELIWATAFEAWQDHPFGIGYGNFMAHRYVPFEQGHYVAEGMPTHNDFLTALVEMGPIGVVALVGLLAVIWFSGRRATRTVLVFFVVSALFHNVLNWRHLWIFVAIALAFDLAQKHGRGAAQAESDEPAEKGAHP